MKKIVVLSVVTAAVLAHPATGSAATTAVTPAAMNGWYFWNDSNDTFGGGGSMVAGPGTPLLGAGSAKLPTVTGSDRPTIATDRYAGTLLSNITALQYKTYRVAPATSSVWAAALQFDIDYDATDAITTFQGRLVWEPYISRTGLPSPIVVPGVWQSWDPYNAPGGWYFPNAGPGQSLCKPTQFSTTCSFAKVRTLFPHAAILARTLFKAGGGWANFNGSVDAFTVGLSGANTTWNFDTRGPVLTPSATSDGNPYPSGAWTNHDVVVHWSCAVDSGVSVISVTADQTVSSEGAGQLRSGSCTDSDGNTTTATFAGINIDKSAPVVSASASPAPNANGWNNTNVTVTFACDGTISGQASLTSPVVLGEGVGQSATGTCVDRAGNSASATASGINVDKTAPVVSASASPAPNANGWNDSDVTVTFDCDASISGQASLSSPVVLGEGAGQSATGTCVDNAGNQASATASGINVDETAPVLGACPPGGPFAYGTGMQVVGPIGYDAGIAGLDADLSVLSGSVDTSATGSVAVVFTAVDRAGNAATSSCSYAVTLIQAKRSVLAEIQAALASANKRDAGELREAAKSLAASIDPALWDGDNRLQSKHGKRVFELEKQAVQKLAELRRDNRTAVPAATLQSWIDALVGVDRALASGAIAAAMADLGADQHQIDEALRALDKGDGATADHDTAAIEHYADAWNKAQAALSG